MRARSVLLVIGAAIALVVGGGAAYAALSGGPVDSSGVIHGCFTNEAVHGSHVLVLQDAGTSCPRGTTAVSWNEAGSTGTTGVGASGPAGSVSLSALQGSPCTVGSHSSTLQVSVNPTTGVVSMTCPVPSYTISVAVSGGTMTSIAIFDDTNDTGTTCANASSCSFSVLAGHAIRLAMESGSPSGGGKTFTYTCAGSAPQTPESVGPGAYEGSCPVGAFDVPLNGDYHATASF
jgi:hypothetical protein